jgi:hypothetical protein
MSMVFFKIAYCGVGLPKKPEITKSGSMQKMIILYILVVKDRRKDGRRD